ncbi:Eco57I restriction-modification methylase domain-containing protein [Yinghuangia sp. ASG 101]|uniref:Eco57I restriction-modification methylase domain-containing protein n=1 Tax=Yinghuangia sp. ASG 101 TaxID=2896848 RepID=UPI001E47637B|nr:Eco57I restriction-modification methylase domain-containing protein [Yinghuangia sp. ASG 101]UGQ11071.1 Eco57I restriction-modification methylase domain-containing protein [Yinghuangia sp. ASG 101]
MVTLALFDNEDLSLPVPSQEAVEHGEVFTRAWVVELILDLVGYTADRDLASLKIVEPACGEGAFLGPIVRRLSASCRTHGRCISDAVNAVRALDLLERNVERARDVAAKALTDDGWGDADVDAVAQAWVRNGDYLLSGIRSDDPVDFVVGNPPYIRIEDVPDDRMAAYRAACPTMGGRADIYVGFYETALRSLAPGGRLGFICADRWMRNQYGSRLREFVSHGYSVDTVLSLHDVDVFEEQVAAYPAITVVSKQPQGSVVAAETNRAFGERHAGEFLVWASNEDATTLAAETFQAARLPHWFAGGDSWPSASPARLAMLEDLADRFGLLENAASGTRVGIGIATGADKVFITQDKDLVEPDRLLPLAMARDTATGGLRWSRSYLVNPWTAQGGLVDLNAYPRMAAYFAEHGEALRRRYVAVKQPLRWYKTIDKVDHHLTKRPKLLFPDMKLTIHPVLDEGGLYPHHNLYFVVSDAWDLRVLGGLLLSKVAEAFVEAYAVKMRGGTLRFQAQYLRKIRVPDPTAMSEADKAALSAAFDRRDVQAATKAALSVYGLAELPD